MANTVDKVLTEAEKWNGYVEKSYAAVKADPSVLYKLKDGAGSGNYTCFGKEMHEIAPSVMDYPAAWCDAFVDYCFYKAYGKANALGLICGAFDDYTVSSAQLYKNKGQWYTSPKKGDQIFFKNSSGICHTGLVRAVDSSYVYTIEGNTSSAAFDSAGGCVCKKQYALGNSRIAGYGRPKYDEDSSASASTAATTAATATASAASAASTTTSKNTSNILRDTSKNGIYKVNASALNCRKSAGTDNAILTAFPNGTKLWFYGYYKVVNGSTWYCVWDGKTKGIQGWVSAKYLDFYKSL